MAIICLTPKDLDCEPAYAEESDDEWIVVSSRLVYIHLHKSEIENLYRFAFPEKGKEHGEHQD